ncbi:MAG: ABC transporter permease subunit [Candidatus Poseidoniales archaeon]|nr:ABC transporter permease subunit [Candidatus Poseidoniales archaeon]
MSDARKQLSRIIIVAKKELVDFVRDWRTVLAMILVPLLIFPAIFIALPLFLQGEAAELSSYELTVEVQGELPEDLSSHLDGRNLIIIQTELLVDGTLSEPGIDSQRLNSGDSGDVIHAILRLLEIDSNASQSWNYAILSDSTDELSLEAKIRTLDAVLTWEADVINATLAQNNLTHDEAFDPIHWDGDQDTADVASGGDLAAMGLAMFIPLVVAMWTTTAAIQPSIDLTAGERERGTMEALLCTPTSRSALLFGKWLAVATVACVSVLGQMAGLLFAINFLMGGGLEAPNISTTGVLLLLLSVILFAIFVVAIELAVAVRAHSVREAGSILGPMVLIFIGPTLFAQFVNLQGIEAWWFVLPVFNITLAMREALMGIYDPVHIFMWVSTSLAYAIGAILWASKQFNREDLVESLS